MPERLANVTNWASRMTEMSKEEVRRRKRAHKEAMRRCKILTRLNMKGLLPSKSQDASIPREKPEEPKQGTSKFKGRVFWKHELDAKRAEEAAKATTLQTPPLTRVQKRNQKRARSDAELAMHIATPTMRGSVLNKLGKSDAKPINKNALKEFYRSHTRNKKRKKRRAKRHK